jgi:lactate permease
MLLPVLALPFFLKNFLTPENLLQTAANKATVNWIALGAGASFALPFIFLSTTGPEFPSLLAGIIGLIIWLGLLKVLRPPQTFINIKTGLAFFHTFKPYLFVALLLLAGKLGLTTKWLISWPAIGLQKNISAFQPGLIFLAGLFLMHFIAPQKHRVALRPVFQQTLRNMPAVLGTIACLAILARLLSQHLSITEIFAADTGMPLFFFSAASVITALLGSFMAGSATVSNLLFGAQWNQVAQHLDLPAQFLLACQLAGAAIGNALSIQNIVMVQAVLNEQALERMVLRKLWKVILLFVLLICLTAFLIGWWLPAG